MAKEAWTCEKCGAVLGQCSCNERIGELVSRLVSSGSLLLDGGLNTETGNYGIFVQWRDESTIVETWVDFGDGGLIRALEKTDQDVSLIANYG